MVRGGYKHKTTNIILQCLLKKKWENTIMSLSYIFNRLQFSIIVVYHGARVIVIIGGWLNVLYRDERGKWRCL